MASFYQTRIILRRNSTPLLLQGTSSCQGAEDPHVGVRKKLLHKRKAGSRQLEAGESHRRGYD